MPGFDRERVLALAALASSEADQDPIDAAIRGGRQGSRSRARPNGSCASFPSIRRPRRRKPSPSIATATSFASSRARSRWSPSWRRCRPMRRRQVDDLAGAGTPRHRRCRRRAERAAPRRPHRAQRSAARGFGALIAALRDMGVRTIMVTGDSAVTAAAIAGKVGIAGAVCPPEQLSERAERRPIRRVRARRARSRNIGW